MGAFDRGRYGVLNGAMAWRALYGIDRNKTEYLPQLTITVMNTIYISVLNSLHNTY